MRDETLGKYDVFPVNEALAVVVKDFYGTSSRHND